ncbi:MAG: secretin N-terminal domain-containing protein, partial [Candidatus Omnitrophota bacterium]
MIKRSIFLFLVILACFSIYIQAEELDSKLDKSISLDLRDMDVVDVYKFLAMKGDFNITISKSIQGRVTLYLKNISISDALDIISLANNLAYRQIGDNIIYVMTAEEYEKTHGKSFNDRREIKILYLEYAKPTYVLEALKSIKSDIGKIVIDDDTGSVVIMDTRDAIKRMEDAVAKIDHPLEMKIYDLKYAKADDIALKLKEKLDNKAVGSVQADTRSNRIIVHALPGRMKEVDSIIDAWDKKTKAVLINVRILKIVFNPKYDFGFDWEYVLNSKWKMASSFPIDSAISSDSSLGSVGQIFIGEEDQTSFLGDLRAVDEISETKVLANPSLMVVDNQEAKIHIGDKLAYVTTTTIGTGESQKVNEEIHYLDVGVQFTVTPTINDNGFVTMSISPEISSQSGELETPQGATVPLVNSTSVETSVVVKDGNTIIIGGLRQE